MSSVSYWPPNLDPSAYTAEQRIVIKIQEHISQLEARIVRLEMEEKK